MRGSDSSWGQCQELGDWRLELCWSHPVLVWWTVTHPDHIHQEHLAQEACLREQDWSHCEEMLETAPPLTGESRSEWLVAESSVVLVQLLLHLRLLVLMLLEWEHLSISLRRRRHWRRREVWVVTLSWTVSMLSCWCSQGSHSGSHRCCCAEICRLEFLHSSST